MPKYTERRIELIVFIHYIRILNSVAMPMCDALIGHFRKMLLCTQGYAVAYSHLLSTPGSIHTDIHWVPSVLFAVAPFSVTVFLEKHEDDFFKYVNPKQSLRRLKRKGVITEDVKSSIERSNTEDALEDLYEHLKFHGNLHTLKEFCKMAIDAEGLPNMQALGRKMMEELPTEVGIVYRECNATNEL